MKTLTDAEKIKFLERRHELILKWLVNQAAICRRYKRIPAVPRAEDAPPSGYWHGEYEAACKAIEDINERHESAACAYETVLEAIENGNGKLMAQMFPPPPFNEYQI